MTTLQNVGCLKHFEGNLLKIISCSIWTLDITQKLQFFQILNLGTQDWHWQSWSSNSSLLQSSQSVLQNLFSPKGQLNIYAMYPHTTDDPKYFSKLHSPLWPKVPQSQRLPFSINIYQEFCLFSLIKKTQTTKTIIPESSLWPKK